MTCSVSTADGTIAFYSDNVDGFDSLADTPSPPLDFYPNQISLEELGPEGNNGAFYNPSPGQPGYDPSGPTYHFISDGAAQFPVPEPGTLGLLGVALAGLAAYRRYRRLAGA